MHGIGARLLSNQHSAISVDGLIKLPQQFLHAFRPLLMIMFISAFQFSQVMCITQGMKTRIGVIGLLVIVTENAVKPGQNTPVIHGFRAASFMRIKIGPALIGGNV